MDFAFFLLIILAFHNSGQILTKKLKFSGPGEAFLFSTALGSILLSVIMTALVFSGLISSAVCWIILGVFFLVGWKNLLHLKHALNTFSSPQPKEEDGLKNMAQSFLGLLVLLSIGLALAPAFATDALVYHLTVPKAFLQAGGLVNLPDNIYSFFPQQIEMLYLFALALSSDSLAQLTGLGVALLLLFALWQYSKQKVGESYAWMTPLIFISTPTFFNIASSAYVDLQAAAYVFLAFYSWENGCTRKQSAWFFLMTLFAGAAVATQLTTIIILPLAILGLAIHGRSHKNTSQTAGQCLVLVLGSLLMLSPWLARNYFFTGNPLFFIDSLSLPNNLTFFSELRSLSFGGQIGILYLLLLPALLGLRRDSHPAVIVFLVLLVFWFVQMQTIHLLAPAFAFLSMLMVSGLKQLFQQNSTGKKEKFFLTTILALGLLFNTSLIMKKWFLIEPLSYLLHKESREQFLTRQIRAYPTYQDANKMLTEKDKVILIDKKNLGYLMNQPFYNDALAETLTEIIDKGVYAADIANRLQIRGINHALFNFNYVFGKDSALTFGEKAIFKNFLIRHGEQLSTKNGFLLYRFMLDSKAENQNKNSGFNFEGH